MSTDEMIDDIVNSETVKNTYEEVERLRKRFEERFKKKVEHCHVCNSTEIYKYDGVGPLCKKCAYPSCFPVKVKPKYPRNKPCPCGSGKKYKKCCIYKD